MKSVSPPGIEESILSVSQKTIVSTSHNPKVPRSLILHKSWARFIAGGMFKPLVPSESRQVFSLGGMIAVLFTSPLDVVGTRLQPEFYRSQRGANQPESFLSPLSSLRHVRETFQILFSIQQVEGWRSLFKGLGPNLVGVVPAGAIKF